jgi:hypothetical protein
MNGYYREYILTLLRLTTHRYRPKTHLMTTRVMEQVFNLQGAGVWLDDEFLYPPNELEPHM